MVEASPKTRFDHNRRPEFEGQQPLKFVRGAIKTRLERWTPTELNNLWRYHEGRTPGELPERILLAHGKGYETNCRQQLAPAFRFVNVGD